MYSTRPASRPEARRLILAVTLCAALAATLCGGCRTVEPWEMWTLSDYTMRPDRDPLDDLFSENIYFTREAATGGRGVGGGGCGCN